MNYHISTWRWINFGKLCLLHKRTTSKKSILDTGAAQGQDQWPQRPRSLQWLRSLGFQEPRLHSRDLGTWANVRCGGAVRHKGPVTRWGVTGRKGIDGSWWVFGDLWWFMTMYLWIDMLILDDFSHYSGRDCFSRWAFIGFIQGSLSLWLRN
jgi:hypothetical protein